MMIFALLLFHRSHRYSSIFTFISSFSCTIRQQHISQLIQLFSSNSVRYLIPRMRAKEMEINDPSDMFIFAWIPKYSQFCPLVACLTINWTSNFCAKADDAKQLLYRLDVEETAQTDYSKRAKWHFQIIPAPDWGVVMGDILRSFWSSDILLRSW